MANNNNSSSLAKCPRKEKLDTEGRQFNERWKSKYMLVLNRDKPACLLCNEAVVVPKEYNPQRHFDTKHGTNYGKLSYQEKKQKWIEQ